MSEKTIELPKTKQSFITKEKLNDYSKRYGMVIILLLMVVGVSSIKPVFLKSANIINIFKQVAVIGTLAYGVTLIIITEGIDLSSGSVVALVGVVSASFATMGGNIYIAILAGLFAGALCGAANGIVIAKTGIPPFIVTLGMMTIARGAALLYSGGKPIGHINPSFLYIGAGKIGWLPVCVLIFLLMGLLSHVILRKTKFGKAIYAIGGNEKAALICGLNVKKVKIIIYTYAGLMSAIGGLMLTARVSSGNPTAGLSYELDAIASVVIGGTSLSGGSGFISGTIIGALIIGVLNNGLMLLGVSPYWQQIIKGLIIVGAVVLDASRNKKSA
jgi:inositol transport system permease protein